MTKLKNQDFNRIFPFDEPRKNQREIIERIIDAYRSGKTHVILQAPTGTGKSVIAYAIAKFFGNGYILTSQKILQEQYFKDLNIPYVLGRNNYTCLKNNGLTCETGLCKKTNEKCVDCPYLIQKAATFKSDMCNLNYSYFLGLIKSRQLSTRNILICDECHNLESELIKTSTIHISEKLLHGFGLQHIKLPEKDETYREKLSWLFQTLLPALKTQRTALKNSVKALHDFNIGKDYLKAMNKINSIERWLSIISEIFEQLNINQKVVISSDESGIEFKVLFGYNLFEKNLRPIAHRFLHMSATVLNKEQYCNNLGLNVDDVEYIECDSNFPIENRLIHYIPVGSMNWNKKNESIPKLITKIDEILDKHSNEKGIIHTVNYAIAEAIMLGLARSKNATRLLMPKGNTRQEILNTFYYSKTPYVLISPSLSEGLDLKEELSRFCIICKVPYANITDAWTKERASIDPNWYNNYTAATLIQMTGRSIRSETDFASSYILDEAFMKFAEQNYWLFPDWWKAAVIEG